MYQKQYLAYHKRRVISIKLGAKMPYVGLHLWCGDDARSIIGDRAGTYSGALLRASGDRDMRVLSYYFNEVVNI